MALKLIDNLKRMDALIARKGTGNPAILAERMNISQTTLFAYIALMKELGTPVKYDKFRQTYYYEEEGNFVISFQRKEPISQ